MFGSKINEFENSDGKRETFNKIFPNTTLGRTCGAYVEIKNIVEHRDMFQTNPYVRFLHFYDHNHNFIGQMEHDFKESNFRPEMYMGEDNVRFKYTAYDLNGKAIATAFKIDKLANELGVSINVVKSRLKTNINTKTKTNCLFNVRRIEL